jgi:hypothetical protein
LAFGSVIECEELSVDGNRGSTRKRDFGDDAPSTD